ncbi:GIDE domain-containing protein [Streptomyces carpaticus]|uniref:RING-type E3 ubiquitin transferase n=1 Tax=Streptomyces carpaticus TaxID=285558 RepID=A0ABV4ZSU6_9ACTN
MFWTGIAALVVAGLLALSARAVRRRVRAIVTADLLTVRELRQLHRAAGEAAGEDSFRYRCEIAGVARPRNTKPVLVSELAGVECVWHRHRVTHRYWEWTTDRNGKRVRRTRERVVAERTSSAAFRIEDATGSVVVQGGGTKVGGAERVMDGFERGGGGSGTIGFRRQEWVLRPGREMHVLGEAADDGGTLVLRKPADGGMFTVSTENRQRRIERERATHLGLWIGALVTAPVGPVLLVLALLR